jgi:hypothetical protein
MAGLGDGSGGSGGGSGAGDAGGGAGAGAGNGSGAGAGGSGAGAGGAGNGAGDGSGGAGTPPAAAGAGAGALGDGGKAAGASWRDTLPEELKKDPTLSKYSDLQNLAKAHVELQKLVGQKNAGAILKPGPNASIEEIKAFRESLGIPTEADKYDLGKFEGVTVPPETVKWAQKLGSDLGIEPGAFNKVISEYLKLDASVQAGQKTVAENKMKESLTALKKEWGDGYDKNMERANFAAKKMGGEDAIKALMEYGAHNDPRIIKAFVEGAKLYGEDTLREGGIGEGKSTPAELDGKIAQAQARLFSMKPTDGAYLSAKTEFESLWKQKTGGK